MKAMPASSGLIFFFYGNCGGLALQSVAPGLQAERQRSPPSCGFYLSPLYLMQQNAEVGLASVCLFVCVRHLFPVYLLDQNRLHQAKLLPFDFIC